MADHPILFSAPMVRALLDGRKTQTRRIMKPQPVQSDNGSWHVFNSGGGVVGVPTEMVPDCAAEYARYDRGDRLWVREAWRCNGWATDVATIFYRASEGDGYTAMCEQYPVDGKDPLRITATWRPGIHMSRWASRLTLIVTDVRVERLQDISEEDAIAEGLIETRTGRWWYSADHRNAPGSCNPVTAYSCLWDQINGAGSWDDNPWVVAVTFDVIKQNIDEVAA